MNGFAMLTNEEAGRIAQRIIDDAIEKTASRKGLYIPDKEMPRSCWACFARHYYFPPIPLDAEVQPVEVVCMAMPRGKQITEVEEESQRPEWCPLEVVE